MDTDQLRAAAERFLPRGTTRWDVARVGVRAGRDLRLHLADLRQSLTAGRPRGVGSYGGWLADHRAPPDVLAAQRDVIANPSRALEVSVELLIIAGPGEEKPLAKTIRSLQVQTDHRWTARVVGGAAAPTDDQRVAVGGSDVDAAGLRAELRDGAPDAFVMALVAGDLCEPNLVFAVADAVWERPTATVVHVDDDLLAADGSVHAPRFRPSWSPDMLLSANYLGRSFAVRRRALDGLPPAPEATTTDAMWWDLLLGLDLADDQVCRVPSVLLHVGQRQEVVVGGAELVAAHLARRGHDPSQVAVEATPEGGVRVRWLPSAWPTVDIVIPTRHNQALMSAALGSLAATDYPELVVRIVDNGDRTPEHEAWYRNQADVLGLDLRVEWWDEPFNYSRVNNVVAAASTADVLVFLNDDTVAVDPQWLREVAGWVEQPDIGLVGLQLLDADGRIQHGGVVLGLEGFAGHLFQGMAPGEDSLVGSTRWYRDALSVTAACVGIRRELFEAIGGFDERFILCGSDVVLGLDTIFRGLRNIVLPHVEVRHLESATRGSDVPPADFFASLWRYQKHLVAGDRYYSPNLSLATTRPSLRPGTETPAMARAAAQVGRPYGVFRQTTNDEETDWLASICRSDSTLRPSVEAGHAAVLGRQPVRTVNWFLPDLDSPFYGGVNTAFRIADQLAADHGVVNRFVLMAAENEPFFSSALAAAFPGLAGSPLAFYDGSVESMEASVPAADVSIATLWVTAYSVAHFTRTARRMYLIQDFEPMFYPAGSLYALTEETYRLGLYGLCNTERLRDIYTERYSGTGHAFMPAVQTDVFHSVGRRAHDHDGPTRVFLYARPGHWRNCWELAGPALDLVKRRFGQDVEIVTAGSWARPEDLGRGIEHRGLLDYRDTGALYRTCDIGIALTLSEHPSYLPLELLACGTPVVAFDNPAGDWLLRHEENCVRTPRTVDGLAEGIGRLVADVDLRSRLSAQGIADIQARHSSWPDALGGIYDFLCDPEAARSD